MADGLGSLLYKAARRREFAVVDPTLERVLSRKAITMKPMAMKDVLNSFLLKPAGKSW